MTRLPLQLSSMTRTCARLCQELFAYGATWAAEQLKESERVATMHFLSLGSPSPPAADTLLQNFVADPMPRVGGCPGACIDSLSVHHG